jgi:hypothetical protein
MDQLYRLKDTFIEYLSPKRRRTVGPTIGTPEGQEQHSYQPASEPQGQKAQDALRGRVDPVWLSPSDARFAPESRKRPREDDEFESHTHSEISPDESASQITASEEGGVASAVDLETEDEEEESDELEEELEQDLEEEPEVSSEDKVAEYLARQAELALRKEAIAQVKAQGDWHPDEVFLFERLSMRSFEEVFPANWKLDFPTLSGELFTKVQENTFINFNCDSSAAGTSSTCHLY